MSWQATAWAEKQKTGSPARKVLLLVLGNYADENGWCWPSQATLAEGTEQSIDTVQRQLRRLESDGHIKRVLRPRAGGHWPGLAYQLNMPNRSTEPQIAARPRAAKVPKVPTHERAPRNVTEPQIMRPGRAATSTVTGPQALRHEYLKNRQPEYLPPPPSQSGADAPQVAGRARAEVQEIERRVVSKLGSGDVAAGWLIFGNLEGWRRKLLEDAERRGALDHATLATLTAQPPPTTGATNG